MKRFTSNLIILLLAILSIAGLVAAYDFRHRLHQCQSGTNALRTSCAQAVARGVALETELNLCKENQ